MKQEKLNNIDLDSVWKNYLENNVAKLFDSNTQKLDLEKEGLCPICGEIMHKKRGSVDYLDKTNKRFNWTVYALDGNKENVQVENLQPVHTLCASKLDEAPKTLEIWKNVQEKLAPAKKPAAKKTSTTAAKKSTADKKPAAKKPATTAKKTTK